MKGFSKPFAWGRSIAYSTGFSSGGLSRAMVTEAREAGSLIGSDKVEGTAVCGAGDAKIPETPSR